MRCRCALFRPRRGADAQASFLQLERAGRRVVGTKTLAISLMISGADGGRRRTRRSHRRKMRARKDCR